MLNPTKTGVCSKREALTACKRAWATASYTSQDQLMSIGTAIAAYPAHDANCRCIGANGDNVLWGRVVRIGHLRRLQRSFPETVLRKRSLRACG